MTFSPNRSSKIRAVEPSHINDLIRLAEETNLSRWSEQSYLDEMKNENSLMLCLIDEAKSVIGFVVGRLVPGGTIEVVTDAEIYNIAITAHKQNKGYGQQLFDAFTDVCRQKNVKSIWLEVRESNKRAISFYEKNAFERVQIRSSFYENPREDAILMKLILK